MAIRRVIAKRQRRRYATSWPINETAARVPSGFPGWPEGKEFAFVLTHDIEGRRGLERCHELAELEIGLGFRSSFNFVPEGEYATPDWLREWLTAYGFEVGVHDLRCDGKLFGSRSQFARSTAKINQYLRDWKAVGFRSGFMLHNLRWLQDLNILYDASTFDTDPFEPRPGGVNTIFPFCVTRGDHTEFVELPYTLPQDSTLFLVLREKSIDTWKQKLEWIAENGGMALLNVHPGYLSFSGRKRGSEYSIKLYQELLEHVSLRYGDRCWRALPRDVAQHVIGNWQSYTASKDWRLREKRAAMVTFSHFPDDPRPRRAAETLVQEGMSVDLICLAKEETPTREVFNGVDVVRVPIRHRREGKLRYAYEYSAFLFISAVMLALRSLLRSYDLIYVHNMPDVLVFSSLIPRVFGSKVVLDLHDPMPELMRTNFSLDQDSATVRWLKRLEKWSIGCADRVVTVNLACKKIFGSRSCPPEKVSVIMNSPDERLFPFRTGGRDALGPSPVDRPFVIMYHGTIVPRNGLDLAIAALAEVRKTLPLAELRIYGATNPFLERVLHAAKEIGVHTAVRYLGKRRLEDLAAEIECCDVGIIPNQRNIFTELNTPTRIFEYLALGKPVIAPRAPGIQDYFKEDSLVFFELGNAEDLARKIVYVYRYPEEMTAVVKRGQEVYLANAWINQRRTLVNLISELVNSEQPSSKLPVD